ncbi:MAG: DNA-binding response regulator [Chloroflexota bacterium]|nr:MAG: DNA-binding response regulator [Chloroflexota bacterium]
MDNDAIRILIADDHSVVRKGLAMVLQLEPGFEVIGETGDGRNIVELSRHLKPDLILLDRMMPGVDAAGLIASLHTTAPAVKIVILTGTNIDAGVLDLLAAGVDGYVFKDIEPHELKQAIRLVWQGEAFLDPAVTRKLLDLVQSSQPHQPVAPLTTRELDVLERLVTPKTYREIAADLHVSEETIRSHAKSILNKLDQPNRAQAALAAIRLGLIKAP